MASSDESLVQWVNSFSGLTKQCSVIQDLSDGVSLFEIMSQISLSHFDVSTIDTNAADNWAHRSSNLKKLIRNLESYYREGLGKGVSFASVDVAAIAKDKDPTEIVKLVEAVLGCAVECDEKETYISDIMQSQDAAYQQNLMMAIQTVMQRFQDAPEIEREESHGHGSNAEQEQQLADALRDKEFAVSKLRDMESATDSLREELAAVKEQLASKAGQDADADKAEKSQDKEQKAEIRREMVKLETDRAELQRSLDEKDRTMERHRGELQQQIEQMDEEIRKQADELDIARSKLTKLTKTETQLAKYKQKLEDVGGLRQQMKELEDQNSQYLDKVLDMESTIKTIPGLKKTLEKYKDQVVELETQNANFKASANVKQTQIEKLREELESSSSAKEFLEEQLRELESEAGDDDEFAGLGGGGGGMGMGSSLGSEMNGAMGGKPQMSMREKCARLERELKDLKAGGGGDNTMLESELDDLKRIRTKLETQLSEQGTKVAQLEMERDELTHTVKTIQASSDNSANAAASAEALQNVDNERNDKNKEQIAQLRKSLVDAANSAKEKEKLYETERTALRGEIAAARKDAQDAKSVAKAASAASPPPSPAKEAAKVSAEFEAEKEVLDMQIKTMTTTLKQKESKIIELSSDKQKLENYTKKTLHAVQAKYMVAMATHKDQIKEKDGKITSLERKVKESKASQKREEDLLVSAFYEVGMELQRRVMSDGQPKSSGWTNRMRQEQSSARNRTMPGSK